MIIERGTETYEDGLNEKPAWPPGCSPTSTVYIVPTVETEGSEVVVVVVVSVDTDSVEAGA
jgi:hypothetical protein